MPVLDFPANGSVPNPVRIGGTYLCKSRHVLHFGSTTRVYDSGHTISLERALKEPCEKPRPSIHQAPGK